MTNPNRSCRTCLATRPPLLERNSAVSGLLPVAIEEPILLREEAHSGQAGDDEEQEPGHRRGVTHVVALETLQIEVKRVEQGRVGRAALAVGHDERLRERLERLDRLKHEVEEEDRR